MRYIETIYGYVNLETAQAIDLTPTGHNVIIDASGNRHRIAGQASLSDVELNATIISASYLLTLLYIWVEDNGTANLERYPIVAWRISDGGWPAPIALGLPDDIDGSSSSSTFVELPSGGFLEATYEGSLLDDLDACKAVAIEKAARSRAKRRSVADPGTGEAVQQPGTEP